MPLRLRCVRGPPLPASFDELGKGGVLPPCPASQPKEASTSFTLIAARSTSTALVVTLPR